jgi:hypothetical protein
MKEKGFGYFMQTLYENKRSFSTYQEKKRERSIRVLARLLAKAMRTLR